MKHPNRREFIRAAAAGSVACGLTTQACSESAAPEPAPETPEIPEERFRIGIQEYTFHRMLRSGELQHIDYPGYAARELGLHDIEYWSHPFAGRHTDAAYLAELNKRTTGEGLNNLLILVDVNNQLDAVDAAERARSLEEHKPWVDCAATLGCRAIRINCRSGGDAAENLLHATAGVQPLCDYAADSGVEIVIEPHGGHSKNPDWLLQAVQHIDRDNLGLLPDFNNFGDFDRYDAVRRTLPHAPAVCAKSLHFDEAGEETNTDYARMLKIVHASDFSGVITVEYEGDQFTPIEGARKTKALIEKCLQELARRFRRQRQRLQ